MVNEITPKNIKEAYTRIRPLIRHTPLVKADHISKSTFRPCDLYFKLELQQLTGSFKIRGVTNKILTSPEEQIVNGIVAASGGNHGRAVAYAGWYHKLPTTVYLPVTTSPSKINPIKSWGAKLILAGQDLDESNEIAAEIALREKKLFIHPYADPIVTAGQGTIAVEILEDLEDFDVMIAAIGGGGLISGNSTYLKSIKPQLKIIGVEPEGCPTLYNSLQTGQVVPVPEIKTNVGTLAIRKTTEQNFQTIQNHVDEVILVTDEEMLAASRWLWQEFGIAAELSGVAPLAALLTGKIKAHPTQKVCTLIGGVGSEGTNNL